MNTTNTIAALNQSLADTTVATMLAQNFHWNVTGMAFGPLHALFQEIYEDHFTAQDDLAERIKALGGFANGNLAQMVSNSTISEQNGQASPTQMIEKMATAQDQLAQSLVSLATIADADGDKLTEDLAIARGQTHEKFAWILKSHLA